MGEILNLIESVSGGFPSYFSSPNFEAWPVFLLLTVFSALEVTLLEMPLCARKEYKV